MMEQVLTHSWKAIDNAEAVANASTDLWSEATAKMAAGDTDAFHLFYDSYFDFMFHCARQSTGRDESTCFDIVQESMLKAMRCMKTIPNAQQLDAFVRVMTHRVALDLLRREARQQRLLKKSQAYRSTCLDGGDSDSEWRIAWLEVRLAELDPEQKQLIDWRYRFGWTLQTIANKMGLKTGSVDRRLRSAVERLRRLSKEENHD